MPSSMLWNSRRPLYRLNLAMLLSLTPFNFLGMVLPYWLETTVDITSGDEGEGITKGVFVNYGIWRQCSDDTGCLWVYDNVIDVHVGDWMYPITIFMLLSSLCHLTAAIMGCFQNFVPREYTRHVRWKFIKTVVHRDASFAEDIGFLAGFFGTASCIIFMLSTKDEISDGAHYQWGFAIALISSTLTVMSSLTLTKSHILSFPRPPNLSPRSGGQGSSPSRNEPGEVGAAAAASSPHPLQNRPVLQAEDVHLEEGGQASMVQASWTRSSRLSSSSRRQRSRSWSRSRERSGSRQGRSMQQENAVQRQSRLMRSLEVENIPAAVTPSSSFQCPPNTSQVAATSAAAYHSSHSSSGLMLCLEMSDLQSRPDATASDPSASSVCFASSQPPVPDSGCGDCKAGSGVVPKSSQRADPNASVSEHHRTQSELTIASPPSRQNAATLRDDSATSAHRIHIDNGASASDTVMTVTI